MCVCAIFALERETAAPNILRISPASSLFFHRWVFADIHWCGTSLYFIMWAERRPLRPGTVTMSVRPLTPRLKTCDSQDVAYDVKIALPHKIALRCCSRHCIRGHCILVEVKAGNIQLNEHPWSCYSSRYQRRSNEGHGRDCFSEINK